MKLLVFAIPIAAVVLASCNHDADLEAPVVVAKGAAHKRTPPPKPIVPPTASTTLQPFDMGTPPIQKKDKLASKVLVVVNEDSSGGAEIGKYYAESRGIPESNFVHIHTPAIEDVSNDEYVKSIETPVKAKLKELGHIEYIVTTKGVPLRVREGRYCVDSLLAGIGLDFAPIKAFTREEFGRARNPYFRQDEHFTHAKYGFYLACRLDGYTLKDIKGLIDNSLAAKPEKGLFFCDQKVVDRVSINDELETEMENITKDLNAKGFEAQSEGTTAFVAPKEALMGYWSSGSNDPKYRPEIYHALIFKPGSIGETDVSSSGRTFYPTEGGQSLSADLVHQGITGVKGYVDEPYTTAVAKPYVMFDRYTKGYNLAETFYMASALLKWKDVVIGDPLCRPYAKDGS